MTTKNYFITLILFLTSAYSTTAQWFTNCNYVGAFDATTDWTSPWANYTPQTTTYPAPTKTVSGDISTNQTWTATDVVLLSGFVYVKNGATLTIQPGCIIRGDKATKGSLIITRGAKLMAEGTAANPIIFTSNEAAGSRNYGDWGGLIILGKAKINVAGGTAAVEGGVDNANGDGLYGGTDDADNSGSLKYVRIEFPGIAFQPNSEINGLTLAAVGNGTTIDYVQVSYSGDDSYEWFGGTVNARHLVAFRGWDDDFDTDFGYTGKVQFGVSLRDSAIADQSGSNGFESDNDGTGSANSPFTAAIFCNITIIGPKADASNPINTNYKRAAHIRRNTRTSIYNSIFTGFPTGLLVDGVTTLANLQAGDFQFENNIEAGCPKYADTAGMKGAAFDVKAWWDNSSRSNRNLNTAADAQLKDPFNYTNPDFRPKTGSPALSGYNYANTRLGGYNNLGLENPNGYFHTNVYPNPANQLAVLHIFSNTTEQLLIQVITLHGAKAASYTVTTAGQQTQHTINTSALAPGLYFIKTTSNNITYTQPLLVSHNW